MTIFLGIFLLSCSALFAGLTIGLMSLDVATLKRKAKHGSQDAAKVLEIREDGMLLLTTLLLGNAAANSFFSIYVGDHFSGAIAGIISTAFIFIFGEVFPQAFLSRHALSFGAHSSPFIHFLLKICYPLCAPIAFLLNKLLGEEAAQVYTKKDILSIIEDESKKETDENKDATEIVDTDEKRIVRGSLSFSHKKVADVMTPNTVVATVHVDDVIDEEYLHELSEIDYSRIPVQTDDPNHITGILYYKKLVGKKLPVKVSDIMETDVSFVNATDALDVVLNRFIKKKVHLFVVLDEFGGFEGVITLEDVIEEIIGTEIMDEGDEVADMRAVAYEKKQKLKKISPHM